MKVSVVSHFLETVGMGAFKRERPSAGCTGLESALLQEKNLLFGAWSQEGLEFFPLRSEQGDTAKQGIAHERWEQATQDVYHLLSNPDS